MRLLIPTAAAMAVLASCRAANADNPPYWHFDGRELGHAPDESDAFTASLVCSKSGRIVVTSWIVLRAKPATIRLSSGEVGHRYRGRMTRDDESGDYVEVRLNPKDDVLRSFRASASLRVNGVNLTAKGQRERRAIADFFAHCPPH